MSNGKSPRLRPNSPLLFNSTAITRDRDRDATPAKHVNPDDPELAAAHQDVFTKLNFGPSKFTSPVYKPSPAEIDKALKYAIILMVSHDSDYLQVCHESKFKEDKIYERGDGLLPSALRSEFMNKLPTWGAWAASNRDQLAQDLEADLQFYDFDDITLTHESFFSRHTLVTLSRWRSFLHSLMRRLTK